MKGVVYPFLCFSLFGFGKNANSGLEKSKNALVGLSFVWRHWSLRFSVRDFNVAHFFIGSIKSEQAYKHRRKFFYGGFSMRKLVSLLLAVCTCLSVGVMLTACDDGEHMHTLTKVAKAEASCETAGNTEYYTCVCGKYFSDAEGTTEIAKDSWVLAATGHSYSDKWTYNETHHWKVAACEHTDAKSEYAEHTLTNNVCACGYTATTYTVTESEWNNLFVGEALNNVSINMDMKLYPTGATEPSQTQNGLSKTAANLIYQSYYDADDENLVEEYFAQKDNKWYHLNQSDNAWIGTEMDADDAYQYTFSGSQGVCFVDKYSAFAYDAENKCYSAENFAVTSASVLDVVKFYVENGKLAKMEFEITNGMMRRVALYTFSDYGTTEIEVPEWTVAS